MSISHIGAFLLGALVATALSAQADSARLERARFAALDTFAQALSTIGTKYVAPVDERKLIYGAISGMAIELDGYSSFLEPDSYRRLRQDTGGEFGGVGIATLVPGFTDGLKPLFPRIDNLVPDSPAARAGVKVDDRLVSIDGIPTIRGDFPGNPDDWMTGLRGRPGSRVTIEVSRTSWKAPRSFTLVRERIKVPTVEWFALEPGIGYIWISKFQEATARDVEHALRTLTEQGMTALILDLRDNPGGLVDQAVAVADLFLEEGVIVSIQGRVGTEAERHHARRERTYTKPRIALLIDKETASAAEIVAGALKDHGRAKVLGMKSFGKGSVQTFYDMEDGSGLKLTTAYYLTPKRHSLHKSGIDPDVHVEMFAPEVIVAGDSKEEEESEEAKPANPKGLPNRLLDDLQFETAHQTARSWLGSKPAMTGPAAKGASR